MKVYLKPHRDNPCLKRIADALTRYAPEWAEVTEDYDEADLVMMQITGRHDHRTIEGRNLKAKGKKYAVIQLVLGSCRNPDPADWQELWSGADVVWSYYDLPGEFNFYHAPLGVDPDVFYLEERERDYIIGSMGNYYKQECIGEVQAALWYRKQGRGVHIGENFNHHPAIDYLHGISDDDLRGIYNRCEWFSCLRRKDGFEMTVLESILCGARPIVFDTPNYKQWFDGLATFIPEDRPEKLTGTLGSLFRKPAPPVTEEHRQTVIERFDWKVIIEGFYAGIKYPDPVPE